MKVMEIKFAKSGEKEGQTVYSRTLTFPDGSESSRDNLLLERRWHSPEQWPWIKPLYNYERDELAAEGETVSQALLGEVGKDHLRNHGRDITLVLREPHNLPEIARVPWEIAAMDNDFLLTDLAIPLVRLPQTISPRHRLTLRTPLRAALISASPTDFNPLEMEQELMNAAFALEEPMRENRMEVHEILNCTREKLFDFFSGEDRDYDIVYFTGHGTFLGNNGYLCLETPEGRAKLLSARDFASLMGRQKHLSLVFLNCCEAAMVGDPEKKGRRGFNDVARRVLEAGVPHVIATQASIFDTTGREVMTAFFRALAASGPGRFDIARVFSHALGEVDDPERRVHDFYQYVHFRALVPEPALEFRETAESGRPDIPWREKVLHRTAHHMAVDKNFVGRFSFISSIEDGWWKDGVKVTGIHGLGGMGKTFLCSRMEERGLTHALDEKRFQQVIWLDFRPGVGDTLAGFLNQLNGVAHDLGFQTYGDVLDDDKQFSTPLEKLRPLSKLLQERFGGRVLLVLDNLETVTDEKGNFEDPQIGSWFIQLLEKTPEELKVLVTSRFRFEFFPDGRQLVTSRWIHLPELGMTERMCLLNLWSELRSLDAVKKQEILKTAGGHPYVVNLVLKYLNDNSSIPAALKRASKEAAQYARLDWFFSLLSPEALDWLAIAALFPEPGLRAGIMNSRAIRDSIEDHEANTASFNKALAELEHLSLVMVEGEEMLSVHPLVAYMLLANETSKYHRFPKTVQAIRRAIGLFFLLSANKTEQLPQKASLLLHGIEPVLAQEDMRLSNQYLQACANYFHGFVPGSVFADIVRRAQEMLLAQGSEVAFKTLGFCAQTLNDMRMFQKALALYNSILYCETLPDSLLEIILGSIASLYLTRREFEKALSNYKKALEWGNKTGNETQSGSIYHQMGRVYEEQREWPKAQENYQWALELNEKAGKHTELGGTYHHVGRVYQEQREWLQALENYQRALEWNEKTGNHFQLGVTYHQMGRVYQEQREWSKALENYQRALEWKEKTGNHFELGGTYGQLGNLHLEQQSWPLALENYKQALEWNEKTGNHFQLGTIYHQVGMVYQKQRQWLQALENYQRALEWNEKTGNHVQLGGTYHQIGKVYEEQQDTTKALDAYLKGLQLSQQANNQREAQFNLNSLRRLFPLLNPEQWEKVGERVGEEMFKEIKN